MPNRIDFKITDFNTWRRGAAPLSPWNESYEWTPVIHNPYGLIQYSGDEVFKRTVLFPVAAVVVDQPVAWALTYNISDTAVRIRGLYVLPQWRGQGIGPALCDFALSLWPEPWNICLGYWRSDTFATMSQRWRLKEVPRHQWRTRVFNHRHINQDHRVVLAQRTDFPRRQDWGGYPTLS